MKKIRRILATTLFISFLLGFNVMAASPNGQKIEVNESAQDMKCRDGVIDTKSENGAIKALVAPSLEVYSITVYPRYYKTEENKYYYGLKSYTEYQPWVGAYPYGLLMRISPEKKAAMDQAVKDKGYTQCGYYYKIMIKLKGDIINGRLEIDNPSGLSPYIIGPNEKGVTYGIATTLENPKLAFSGKFMYYFGGKEQGSIFSAVAIFED